MRSRIPTSLVVVAVALATLLPAASVAQQAHPEIPRTPDGRPDLSGTYDPATLTPLQRPKRFGTKLILTEEEASGIAEAERAMLAKRNSASDPNRKAPAVGGDGSKWPSGNVGGYNLFWIDRGAGAFQIDGQWRTSIITDPANGRRPAYDTSWRREKSGACSAPAKKQGHGLVARERPRRARSV